MNYGYQSSSRKEQLLRELNAVEQQLSNKNQSLERLKLEAEFYQDNPRPAEPNMNLADQIMNQLMGNPKKPVQAAPYSPPYAQPLRQSPPKQLQRPVVHSPPRQPLPSRENNFINERELQKNKLQNQKHQGLFPNSREHQRVRSKGKPQHIKQQQNFALQQHYAPSNGSQQQYAPQNASQQPYVQNFASKQAQYIPEPDRQVRSPKKEDYRAYDPTFNPFVPDQRKEKERKEAQHREYLRYLQEQREQQLRAKEQRLKQQKQYKGQFHDFNSNNNAINTTVVPVSAPKQAQKPTIMKKSDPNSRPPKIEPSLGNFSQFDKTLIMSKAIQLKNRFKKGKIIYEQFQRQWANFSKQYKGDLQADYQAHINSSSLPKQQQKSPPKYEEKAVIDRPSPVREQESSRNESAAAYPIRNQSINYSQFMPSHLQHPSKANQQNFQGMMSSQGQSGNQSNVPAQYMDMMRKMFEVCIKQMRETYNQRLVHQDQAFQQTLTKFLQQSQNPFMTQQIGSLPSPNQQQFYSNVKQHRQLFEKESTKRKPVQSTNNLPYPNQSDTSQYYDKSLSGVASKIPLKNVQQSQQHIQQASLSQFYSKPYKVKKLTKFAILIDPNQSQLQIPSTSAYMRSKHAKEELQSQFQQDLIELKKMQSQRGFNKAANRINNNNSNNNPRQKSISRQVTSKEKEQKLPQTAFLKKHVSNEDPIMTFSEENGKKMIPHFSPSKRNEILQQQEYQTETRGKQDESRQVASYAREYQQHLQFPSKALNFIKHNNEMLSKYDKKDTPKQTSSGKDYFSNNQISPVRKQQNYEESLQTIRSDYQSAKHIAKYIRALDTPQETHNRDQGKPESKQKQIREQILQVRQQRKQGRQERRELRQDKKEIRDQSQFNAQRAGIMHSQTVQSVQQSSSKHRPPKLKRNSVGRKKQSSIVRSKFNAQNSISAVSKGFNEDISVSKIEMPKFDSNVYESQYEQSMGFKPDPKLIIKNQSRPQPVIEINPPVVPTPRSPQKRQPQPSIKEPSPQRKEDQQPAKGKWKSLQQARRLAKQCRAKGIDESKDFKSVQERFSELQSFMTRKGQESLSSIKREPVRKQREKSPNRSKKNIMKLLEQLQDGQENQYKQEFDSYREQSQNYQ